MKRNFFALITLLAVVLTAVGFSFAQAKTAVQTNQLAAMLPTSDAVAVVDMKRLTQDAAPQILSGNLKLLADISAQLSEIKNQTGIDLLQFEQVAVGLSYKQTQPKIFDFEPIIIARGKIDSKNILTTAQTTATGKFREEKIGNKTVYVFRLKEILEANRPQSTGPKNEETINKSMSRIPEEIAATAFDNETLIVGTIGKIRETLSGSSRANAEILSLVNSQSKAVVSFAGNVPAGMSQFWNLDNDEIGKTIDSIRLVYGTVDVTNGNTLVSIAAKTYKAEQAKNLEDTLVGLQSIGKGFLGGMKGDDKQIYARILESAKIARAADQVTINLQVANTDVNALLGKK